MNSSPQCSFLDELNSLCKQIKDSALKGFEDLIKSCNIDINQNVKLSSEYYSLVKSNDKTQRQIKRLRFWRWFLIIFLVFPFILMTNAAKKKQTILDGGLKEENKIQVQLDEQLAYFFPKISYDFCYKQIIEPLWKDIKIDIYHDEEAYETWIPWLDKIFPKDACLTTLLSGKIFNNPFIIYNFKDQLWGTHVYTGSVPITYTVHINGKAETRTEFAVATEALPEPYWNRETRLSYHFDKAEKLCFTNNISKSEFKKWNKKNQLPLENNDFNKVFPTIRNDETQFRVLFTPLAQENYVKLLKQHDFVIVKDEQITTIQLPNNDNPYLDVTPNEAFNYNVQTWANNYADWVTKLIKDIGLLTLPIANIPLYTQFKTNVVKDTEQDVASYFQVQDNLSHLFDILDKWQDFDTDVVFHPISTKTTKIKSTEFSLTTVKCDYFYPLHKVITKIGVAPSGRTAIVPINVIEYLPKHRNIVVCQSTNLKCSTKEQIYEQNMTLHRGQLMFIAKSNQLSQQEISNIEKILEQKKKED